MISILDEILKDIDNISCKINSLKELERNKIQSSNSGILSDITTIDSMNIIDSMLDDTYLWNKRIEMHNKLNPENIISNITNSIPEISPLVSGSFEKTTKSSKTSTEIAHEALPKSSSEVLIEIAPDPLSETTTETSNELLTEIKKTPPVGAILSKDFYKLSILPKPEQEYLLFKLYTQAKKNIDKLNLQISQEEKETLITNESDKLLKSWMSE